MNQPLAPTTLNPGNKSHYSTFNISRSRTLSKEETLEFAQKLDAIRDEVMSQLGKKDADYIYRVRDTVRYSEILGRALLMFGGRNPVGWLAGVAALSVSKIVENMELGHNVMHGQYDWMNDASLHGDGYDWDNVCAGPDWKRTHNFEHHTFTNVIGRDRDIGYGLVRISPEQPWHWDDLFNLPKTLALAVLFEWGVGLHGLHLVEKTGERSGLNLRSDKVNRQYAPFVKKMLRQVAKDYIVFPALAGKNAVPVLLGNSAANIVRNIWAFAIIFCGHFTEDVELFEDNIENETRAEWYIRQIRGSCNIEGGPLFHFFSGNLSHQIEHHVFPSMPANRYAEVAPKVRALCAEYGQHYDTGRFSAQLGQVFKRIALYSLPNKWATRVQKIIK